MALIEKRHSDTVNALKSIHQEELINIKEVSVIGYIIVSFDLYIYAQRMKEADLIERMSSQISTASGNHILHN